MTDPSEGPRTATLRQTITAALISSGVFTFVGGALLARHTERVGAEIKAEFDRGRRSDEWRQQSIADLLGPVVMELDRTRRAYSRYTKSNRYLESQVLYKSNLTIRDLLLAKGYLIPDELRDVSSRLVEHYDAWLEEYDRIRGARDLSPTEPFVFAGPKGYPFPSDADSLFNQAFRRYRAELYTYPNH